MWSPWIIKSVMWIPYNNLTLYLTKFGYGLQRDHHLYMSLIIVNCPRSLFIRNCWCETLSLEGKVYVASLSNDLANVETIVLILLVQVLGCVLWRDHNFYLPVIGIYTQRLWSKSFTRCEIWVNSCNSLWTWNSTKTIVRCKS